jgi:hypothetical protein
MKNREVVAELTKLDPEMDIVVIVDTAVYAETARIETGVVFWIDKAGKPREKHVTRIICTHVD